MKIIHISDLHFGKVIHGVSLLENGDQPDWTNKFLALTADIHPDAVVIAGDVYDRSSPSGEAVALLSRLLVGLEALGISVMLVAGNHDSGARLAFAREILARQNIHIAGKHEKKMTCVTLHDSFGPVHFWLMPYVFPAVIAQLFDDGEIHDYDTAVRRWIAEQDIRTDERNVIIAHQNVTVNGKEGMRGGSEGAVGGVGQVGYTALDCFDYAALGHIHAAYPVGRNAVRYAGSPLCYHFDETVQPAKGPLLVEMGEKGADLSITTLHLPPLHPMRVLKGETEVLYQQLLSEGANNEYWKLVITDQPLTPDISTRFQSLAETRGSILMERCSEFRRFSQAARTPDNAVVREMAVEELFVDFYTERSGGQIPEERDIDLLHFAGELLRNHPADTDKPDEVDDTLKNQLMHYLMAQEEGKR